MQKAINESTPDFILHGMLHLQKSIDSENDVVPGSAERRILYGEITNNNPDEEGERMIQKSLDFSYFDDQGWIKYEHVANDPKYIIGCPHERVMSKDGKSTIVKGALFNNKKLADDTWELIQSINEHNKLYPEHQKTLGWSIEGNYTDGKVSKGGTRKAKVINVVLTPSPVNKSVWLKTVEDNHNLFAKSLSATPTSNDVSQKTGGDAIAKDNIDKKVKLTAEELEEDKKQKKSKKKSSTNSKKSTGSKTMFKNIEEATQHFVDQGESQENAEKLAKSMFPDDADPENAPGDVLKGIQTTIENLQKSVEKAIKPEDDDDADLDLDNFSTVDGVEENEVVDAAPFLMNIQKGINDLTTLFSEKVSYDNQRDIEFAKSLDMVSQFNASVESLQKSLVVKNGENEISVADAVVLLMKAQASGKPIDISKLDIEVAPTGDGNLNKDEKKMSFAELQGRLEKGLTGKTITSLEAAQAESAWRQNETAVLDAVLNKITE